MSVYERLFKEQERLRKQFYLLDEKLEYLEKESIKASSGSKAFELKKEKEETEDGLDEISFQLDNVEQKINKLDMSRIFNLLLELDCHHHVERFIDFVSFQKAGAFFIHSSEKYSLRLLLKRLLQEIEFCVTEQPIIINLPSVFTRYGGVAALNNFDIAESLWYELGRKVGLRRPSPEQIAQKLAKKRKTQNVILVLEEVDFRYDLNEIVGKFWSDLSDKIEQTSNFYFLMILVADDSCFNDDCIDFFEIYDETWRCQIPVRLPMLDKFEAEDLLTWIKRARGIFDIEIKKHADQIVKQMITCCDGGSPDRVIEYICTELCQCEFDEGIFEKWLTTL